MSDQNHDFGEKLTETLSEIQSHNESQPGDEIQIPSELDEKLSEALYSDPLLRRLISEAAKRRWIDQYLVNELKADQQAVLMKLIMNSSMMWGEDEIEHYIQKDDVAEIYEKVQLDFEQESISDDLKSIYNTNLESVLREIVQRKEELKKSILGNKYSEIKELEESDRNDKEQIISKIITQSKAQSADERWTDIEHLENMKSYISSFPYTEQDLNADLPAINGDKNRFLKHCAIRIQYPRRYTQLYLYEPDYKDYPLKWLNLGVSRNRHAYELFKTGDLPEEIITNRVDDEHYIEDLLQTAESIPPYRDRLGLLQEALDNYTDGRYASVINLLLPQIEYLMWRYAAYLDARHNVSILVDSDHEDFWNFSPRDNKQLKLRNVDGNLIEDPKIRDLVSQTALGEFLRPEIVEYFGNEIFSDRNPILHGNTSDYYSKVEAAKKIVFFQHVAEELVETIVRRFADEVDDSGLLENTDLPADLMSTSSGEN